VNEINFNVGVSGTYELLVHNNGKLRTKTETFKNLITDYGLDYVARSGLGLLYEGSGTSIGDRCVVGTGTAPPLGIDNSLQNQVFASGPGPSSEKAAFYKIDQPGRYVGFTWECKFPISGYIGTINEVGIKASSTSNLFSRAVLPTPLELIAGDELTVIYKLYNSVPDTPIDFNISDGIRNYTVTLALVRWSSDQIGGGTGKSYGLPNAGVYGYSSTLMDAIAHETDVLLPESSTIPTGSAVNAILISHVTNSFEAKILYRWTALQANYPTGIGRICLESNWSQGAFQFKFSPKIPKTSTNRLELVVKYTFSRGTPPV
jgi:hypothetical protein